MFNFCEAFFSGFFIFPEECSSSLLGYLLAPLPNPYGHGLGIQPLRLFLEELGQQKNLDEDHRKTINKMLNGLTDEVVSSSNFFSGHLARDPFNEQECTYRLSVSLEYSQIDLLIRFDNMVLVFENKIRWESIKSVKDQVCGYCRSIAKDFHIIPVVVFPPAGGPAKKSAQDCYLQDTNIIQIVWTGSEKLSLLSFMEKLLSLNPEKLCQLKDFIKFIHDNFGARSRPLAPIKQSYQEMIARFPIEVREAVKTIFPENKTLAGTDCSGGSLIYCLFLPNGIAYPFRITINKFEIQDSGFGALVFPKNKLPSDLAILTQKKLRDIVRIKLKNAGLQSIAPNAYSFYIATLIDEMHQKAVLDIIHELSTTLWTSDKIFSEHLEYSKQNLSKTELVSLINSILFQLNQLPEKDFQHHLRHWLQLYHTLNMEQKTCFEPLKKL